MTGQVLELLPHQEAFLADTTTKTVALVGGYGSGKSFGLALKALDLARRNQGFAGVVCEPTQTMLRKVIIPTFNELFELLGWQEGKHYTYRKSNPESYIIHFPGGDSTIYLLGAENYKRLVGMNLAWFAIDEIDTIASEEVAKAAFNQCHSRLRVGNTRQGFLASTPEGFGFLYRYFVEEALDKDGNVRTDRKLINATTYDNPKIPHSYIAGIKANYPPKIADAYLLGQFVNMTSGNVYSEFDRTVNSSTKTFADFSKSQLHVGMDFNVGNMSAVVIGVDEQGCLHVIDEINGEKKTESLIKILRERYPDQFAVQDGLVIYPDSSGKSESANADQSSIVQLKMNKLTCKYNGNNPSIMKERVPSVNAAFKTEKLVNGAWVPRHRLFVNTVTCPVTTKGLEQQGLVKGKPDKSSGLDHTLDALGYAIWFLLPIKGKNTYAVHG